MIKYLLFQKQMFFAASQPEAKLEHFLFTNNGIKMKI